MKKYHYAADHDQDRKLSTERVNNAKHETSLQDKSRELEESENKRRSLCLHPGN